MIAPECGAADFEPGSHLARGVELASLNVNVWVLHRGVLLDNTPVLKEELSAPGGA